MSPLSLDATLAQELGVKRFCVQTTDVGTDIAQELGVCYHVVNAVPSVYDYEKPMAVTCKALNDYCIFVGVDTPTFVIPNDFGNSGVTVVTSILDLFSCLYRLSWFLYNTFRYVCTALCALVPHHG